MEEFLLADRSQRKILNFDFCFGKVLNLRQGKQRPLKLTVTPRGYRKTSFLAVF